MKTRITRKEFMKLSAMAAMALPVAGLYGKSKTGTTIFDELPLASNPYATHPGLQVYSVREAFKNDPSGTLKRIAGIGFKELELHDIVHVSRAKEVSDLGMRIIGTHIRSGYISGIWETMSGRPAPGDKLEDIIEIAAKNGVKNIGVGIIFPSEHQTFDDYKRFAEKANHAGEKTRAAGIQLYYHNHSFEFEPHQNTTPLEAMVEVLDKDLVKIELDVFWVTVSGNNPAEWIKKLSGRIKFLHLKDVKKDTPKDYTTFKVNHDAFQALGDGVINFKEVIVAALDTKIPHTFIEQDFSVIDPFESIAKSFNYLKNLSAH